MRMVATQLRLLDGGAAPSRQSPWQIAPQKSQLLGFAAREAPRCGRSIGLGVDKHDAAEGDGERAVWARARAMASTTWDRARQWRSKRRRRVRSRGGLGKEMGEGHLFLLGKEEGGFCKMTATSLKSGRREYYNGVHQRTTLITTRVSINPLLLVECAHARS
jgi:hypothetical protein